MISDWWKKLGRARLPIGRQRFATLLALSVGLVCFTFLLAEALTHRVLRSPAPQLLLAPIPFRR